MKIRNDKTGEIIDVPEDKLGDYGITAQNPSIQSNSGGLAEGSGNLLMNILKGVVKPFENTANRIEGANSELKMNRGKANDTADALRSQAQMAIKSGDIEGGKKLLDQALGMYQGAAKENPFLNNEELARASDPEKAALDIAKDSAGILSYAVPGGGATKLAKFGKGAAQGALTGFSQSGDSTANILGNTALGALTGGTGEVLLSKLFSPGAGAALNKAGEGLENRAFVTKFGKPGLKEGGVNAFKEFSEQGINIKGGIEDMAKSAQEVLETEGPKVHQIATELSSKPNTEVQQNVMTDFLDNLKNSKKTPEMQAPINDVAANVKQMFGDKPISLEDLYAAKQEWGQLGKWSPTATTAENTKASVYEELYKKANDILDKTFKENGYENFAQMNKKVSTAIKASHFAERRGAQIVSNNPLGLMDIAAAGGGAAVMGGPGAIGAYALNKTIQSPAVQGAAGKAMQLTGTGLDKVLGATSQDIVGKVGALGASNILPAINNASSAAQSMPQNQSQSSMPDINALKASPSQTAQSRSGVPTITSDMLQQARVSLSDKSYAKIKDLYDLQQGGSNGGAGKVAAKDLNTAKSASTSLDQLDKILQGDPNKLAKAMLPGAIGARDYEAAARNVLDGIARLRTGAAMSKNEESFYRAYLPSVLDPPDVKLQKIQQLRDYFESFNE